MKTSLTRIASLLICVPGLAAAQVASQTMETSTSNAWYSSASTSPARTIDWKLGYFKGECPRSNYVMNLDTGSQWFSTGTFNGLSGDYYHRMMIHGLKCDNMSQFLNADFSAPANRHLLTYLDFNVYGSPGDTGTFPKTTAYPSGWNWDPYYEKATCPPSTPWVTGIAQSTDGSGIRTVQCAPSAIGYERNDNTCTVKLVGVDYDGSPHGSGYEWDFGYQKGLCDGGAIAGISRNVPSWDANYGGGLHAILCCGLVATFGTP